VTIFYMSFGPHNPERSNALHCSAAYPPCGLHEVLQLAMKVCLRACRLTATHNATLNPTHTKSVAIGRSFDHCVHARFWPSERSDQRQLCSQRTSACPVPKFLALPLLQSDHLCCIQSTVVNCTSLCPSSWASYKSPWGRLQQQ